MILVYDRQHKDTVIYTVSHFWYSEGNKTLDVEFSPDDHCRFIDVDIKIKNQKGVLVLTVTEAK